MAKLTGGERFAERLKEIAANIKTGATLRCGWPDGDTYPDGTLVGLVAAFNEFGVPSHNQPPRPFLRNMIAEHSGDWPEMIAELLKRTDYDANAALNQLGPELVGEVQDSITKFTDPALAPSTIARKGFNKPLVETGQMRKDVTFEVE